VFNNAASRTNGPDADIVLGQTSFLTSTPATTQSGMQHPIGVAVNNGAGKLYVADENNSRILIFDAGVALPIQLASISGTLQDDGSFSLEWMTLSEVNNYGFYVERKSAAENAYKTVSGLIPGAGTSLEGHSYSWIDAAVPAGMCRYRLRQQDLDGKISYSSEIQVMVVLGVKVEASPRVFQLLQNYPNPFNPTTSLKYDLPVVSRVRLTVLNIVGQVVAVVADEIEQAGYKSVEWNATSFASGIYYYRIEATSINEPGKTFTQVRRMILLK
jgi:hypothetical protein